MPMVIHTYQKSGGRTGGDTSSHVHIIIVKYDAARMCAFAHMAYRLYNYYYDEAVVPETHPQETHPQETHPGPPGCDPRPFRTNTEVVHAGLQPRLYTTSSCLCTIVCSAPCYALHRQRVPVHTQHLPPHSSGCCGQAAQAGLNKRVPSPLGCICIVIAIGTARLPTALQNAW